MKKTKHKTIKYPKTESQAIDLILKISKRFNLESVIITKSDFTNKMGTEDWVKDDYELALHIASDYVANFVGESIDETINQINSTLQ
jgi:hypothetical protein